MLLCHAAKKGLFLFLQGFAFFALFAALGGAAAADPALTVRALEAEDLAAAISRLREGLVGPTLHIQVVNDQGAIVPCGGYALAFDEDGRRAFVTGSCDPQTSSTELILTNPHALFIHTAGIAQPIRPVITATVPPPPPPLPPPPASTCWAVIGPTLLDPETGRPQPLNPTKLFPKTEGLAANTFVQVIAFDQGFMLRLREDLGIRELAYVLAPAYFRSPRRSGTTLYEPSTVSDNVLRTRLPLRCGDDPLGPLLPQQAVPVPQRIKTVSPDGQPVLLQRRQSDLALKVEKGFGNAFYALAPTVMLIGIIMAAAGSSAGEAGIEGGGITLVGGGVGLIAAGGLMANHAARKLAVRAGTVTVTPLPAN